MRKIAVLACVWGLISTTNSAVAQATAQAKPQGQPPSTEPSGKPSAAPVKPGKDMNDAEKRGKEARPPDDAETARQKRPAKEDRERIPDCLQIQLRPREMDGYEFVRQTFSSWKVEGSQPGAVSGVRNEWVRKRDGLQVEVDVAVFPGPAEAQKAADTLLEGWRQPVRKSRGPSLVAAEALDRKPVGEKAWSQRPSKLEVKQLMRKKNVLVSITCRHGSMELADTVAEELGGRLKVLEARIKQ